MVALPTVGGDSGAWGAKLNEFLQVSHNADGTLKSGSTDDLFINVKDPAYGAVGNGTTDDSAAFIAAHAAARAAIVSAVSGANSVGRIKIVIPPGRYKLVTDNAMMPATSGTRTRGIVYEGAGRGVTEILWQPSGSGKNLMRNNDVWLGVTVRGISFWNATAGSRFLYSSSTGGAQDYFFEDCAWDGTADWDWGIGLDGSNNNAEWEFHRCTFDGAYDEAFLWSGMTAADSNQDQFVNFDFYSCNVFLDDATAETWLRFDFGGNIRIFGGNYILDAGSRLFYLAGNTHAQGVEQFAMFGGRIELRDDTCKVIDSEWGAGQITFIGVDESTNTSTTSVDAITATYLIANGGSPQIRYQSCRIAGRHEYLYESSAAQVVQSVVYDQCLSRKEPRDFIVYTANGGHSNAGARPAIDFRRWKAKITNDELYIPDQTVGWEYSKFSQPQRYLAQFRDSAGTLGTSGTLNIFLPLNSVITAVHFYKKTTGAATNTNWSYTVQTNEGSPTVLGAASGGGAVQWQTGWNEVDTVNRFVCDSDAKRELDLVVANVTETTAGTNNFVIVEYWA